MESFLISGHLFNFRYNFRLNYTLIRPKRCAQYSIGIGIATRNISTWTCLRIFEIGLYVIFHTPHYIYAQLICLLKCENPTAISKHIYHLKCWWWATTTLIEMCMRKSIINKQNSYDKFITRLNIEYLSVIGCVFYFIFCARCPESWVSKCWTSHSLRVWVAFSFEALFKWNVHRK